jgi:RimJ/RimL family protein N-acetyltransferase
MEYPIIETDRCRLRVHRAEDFDACAAMWADPIVTRYIGDKPFSKEETWARLLRFIGHWTLLGFGYWAVEDKRTGNFIGEIGFADYKRDIQPSIDGIPEIGWVLVPSAHGKGYATETVRAALAWGDAHFGAKRTVCLIHPDNVASVHVAEKCSYKESQRTTYKGQPVILFTRNSWVTI